MHFISFLHAFYRKQGHNMLALMFDSRFKSTQLITAYLARENATRENATPIVVQYDEKLLLLLTKITSCRCILVLKKFNLKSTLKYISHHNNECRHLRRPCVKKSYWISLVSC